MKILSIVEYSLRKPLCVSFRILFSSRNVLSQWYSIDVNNFPTQLNNVIGR